MFRSKLIVPVLSVVCLLASQAVVPTLAVASPLRTNISMQPFFGAKMVKLSLANNTKSPLDIKVGDTAMTIAPGATMPVAAPAGTKITFATAVTTHAAGEVLTQLSPELSGVTIRVN
jgi:hypothetical protein